MFTLISNIIDYFIPEERSGTITECNSDNLLDKQHDDNSPFLFGYNEVTNIRSVSGKVTHVFHGHGLIDKDIYFSKADLPTDVKLEV